MNSFFGLNLPECALIIVGFFCLRKFVKCITRRRKDLDRIKVINAGRLIHYLLTTPKQCKWMKGRKEKVVQQKVTLLHESYGRMIYADMRAWRKTLIVEIVYQNPKDEAFAREVAGVLHRYGISANTYCAPTFRKIIQRRFRFFAR